MDHTTEQALASELICAASALVERGAHADARDAVLAGEVAVLRADLDAAAAEVADPELADDLAGAAATLDALATRLDRLPPRITSLTG